MKRLPLCLFFLLQTILVFGEHKERLIIAIRSSDLPIYREALNGFQRCLQAQKVPYVLEDYTLQESEQKMEDLVNKLRARNPDLILTMGSNATRFADEKFKEVPRVFCMVVDPASNNFKNSGVVLDVKPAAQISYIRKNFPQLHRIGVLYSAERNKEVLREMKDISTRENIPLAFIEVNSQQEMSKALTTLKANADCLLMVSDHILYSHQTVFQFILETLRNGIPMFAISSSYVKAGALAGIYADYENNGCLASEVAVRLFNGESMAEIPIYWPTKMDSAINLVVADRLKIKVSNATFEAAEQVIK